VGIIFVGGVHGVGKTTSCKLAATRCRVSHYSASSLISREKESAISKTGKSVDDIEENQGLLIQAANRLFGQSREPAILDGHFTLINGSGDIERVSSEIFFQLPIGAIVVYCDTPQAIADRISERDSQDVNVDFIGRHQEIELEQAQLVARKLGVPFSSLKAFDESGLVCSLLLCREDKP